MSEAGLTRDDAITADVIVAGAGPAGCATAITAARAGLGVLLLDKAPAFPRPKACGDALTPRAVAALAALGVTLPAEAHKVTGLAAYGSGGQPHYYPWPTTAGYPVVGYTMPRAGLDAHLLAAAQAAGVKVELGQTVTGLVLENGRATGVTLADGSTRRAPVVVDAGGASAKLGEAIGLPRQNKRPLGVAVRGYMRGQSPLADEAWLHSWLALTGPDGAPLSGYGWVFPLGGGLYNVGVGQLSTSPTFRRTDYRGLLRTWAATLPPAWGLEWVSDGPGPAIMGAGLPMGLNRPAVYRRGVLLTGDAAGLVNPFNGEGVSYALASGRMAGLALAGAEAAGFGTTAAETALQGYHHSVKAAFGRYMGAGNRFAALMGHEAVLAACLRYGLPRPLVMRLANKLMSNLIAPQAGPWDDRLLRGLVKIFG